MTAMETTQSFQEKMLSRIRKDIGELLPDDDLAALIAKAVSDIMGAKVGTGKFEKQEYGSAQEIKIPWIEKEIRDKYDAVIEKKTAEMLNTFFAHNADYIVALLIECFKNSAPLLLHNLIQSFFTSKVDTLDQNLLKLHTNIQQMAYVVNQQSSSGGPKLDLSCFHR